jgi:hypothetical protein
MSGWLGWAVGVVVAVVFVFGLIWLAAADLDKERP